MYTFLIIDDEPVVREGIADNIDWQSHGFTLVGVCRDGREGMQSVEELHPDVVLTDICMPFVDGLELAAFIAERYPETKTILLTGYDEFDYAQEAVKLKVTDFLLKPITPDEFRAVLDRIRAEIDLERRKQRDLEKLKQQLQESLPLLRDRFLNRLIYGETEEQEALRRLSLLELDLPGPYFNLMIVDPDSFNAEDDLENLAIQNAVEAVTQEKEGQVLFHTRRDRIVVLFSAMDKSTSVLRALECAEAVSERVRRSCNAAVSIGIGSPVKHLAEIEGCYRGALTALGQRLVLGTNQIITADQVGGSTGSLASHTDGQAHARVIRELKSGTTAQAEMAVRELVRQYRSAGLGMRECYIGMQRLLADMLNALESLGVHYSEVPEIAEDPFGALGKLKTLEAIEQWLCTLLVGARAVLARRQKQHSVEKARDAEEYIAAHHAESGLSLSRLCRALSISKSYFSAIFKAHTGMTFVEYLTNLRMERAKELLGSTDLRGYEVAERVGFTNAHYFSLTFRKQTSLSPTEYRESVRDLAR